jgi:phospholipid/cholesterol/gamma-HCH transport system substrate-binding protein
MARPLEWRSLTGGIVAFVVLVAVAVTVVVYGNAGALHGDTFDLFVATGEGRGVIKGTDVWLSGQRVGTVTNVTFLPPSAPMDERLIIHTKILSNVRLLIRADSKAEIRAGGTVIAAPVIAIETGTRAARAVADGDTIHAQQQSDLEQAASDLTRATDALPEIVANVKGVMRDARQSGAHARAILAADGPAARARANVSALRQRMTSTRGTLGRAVGNRDALVASVRGSRAAFDSIRTLVSSRSAALGRFRRDSSLIASLETLRNDVAEVRRIANAPEGTIGRARTDSAFLKSVDSVFLSISALLADVKQHPMRYLHIF